MNVGEFNSFITIEKNRYDTFKAIFEDSTGKQLTITDASSEKIVTSSWCGCSTEELFVFIANGSSSALLSADKLADILDATPDSYEMVFINKSPGIPVITGSTPIENAKLEDISTSSIGDGTKKEGILYLYDVPPTPCSSSSSSSC